jgi:hypothetical protein
MAKYKAMLDEHEELRELERLKEANAPPASPAADGFGGGGGGGVDRNGASGTLPSTPVLGQGQGTNGTRLRLVASAVPKEED